MENRPMPSTSPNTHHSEDRISSSMVNATDLLAVSQNIQQELFNFVNSHQTKIPEVKIINIIQITVLTSLIGSLPKEDKIIDSHPHQWSPTTWYGNVFIKIKKINKTKVISLGLEVGRINLLLLHPPLPPLFHYNMLPRMRNHYLMVVDSPKY